MASVVTDLTDQSMAPGYLNGWLRENKGFASGNLFVFASVAPLGLRLAEMIRCQSQPAPIERLAQLLEEGAALVALVDSQPGGDLDSHWVRLLAIDAQDGQIMDPWQLPGKELKPLSTYFASGWTPERAIFMVAVYTSAAQTRGPLAEAPGRGLAEATPEPEPVMGAEYQPALCVRPSG